MSPASTDNAAAAAPPTCERRASSAAATLIRPAMAVGLLLVVSAVVRIWLGRGVPTPWISPDEMIYGLLGRTFYRTGRLTIENASSDFYSLVYPLLIGGPLAWARPETGYAIAKALGAVAMSLAAVPAYLWTRSVASGRAAVAVAALTLALPAFSYSGLLMTETVFYPLAAATGWAMARALVAPTARRQLLLAGLTAACILTRLQGVVLLAAFPLAALLHEGRLRRLGKHAPAFAALGLLVVAWAAWRLLRGGGALGAYTTVASGGYHVGAMVRYVVYHVGDLGLLTGFLPLWTTGLLWFERRRLTAAQRAALAVATSIALLVAVQVGTFASRYVGHLAERDLIAAAPPLFVCLAVWLDLGAPRTRRRVAAVALVGLGTLYAWPLHTFLTASALPDSASLVTPFRLVGHDSLGVQQLLLDGAAATAALVLWLAPRTVLRAVPLVLVAALGAQSIVAERYAADQARQLQMRTLGPNTQWIDAAAGGPVTFLYGDKRTWPAIWESLFWNRRVDRVLALPGARLLGPAPGGRAAIEPDGTVLVAGLPTSPRFVTAASAIQLAGTAVADAGKAPDGTPVARRLWRLDGPLRMLSLATGFQLNGDIYGSATVHAFGCPGTLQVTLLVKEDERINLYRDDRFFRGLRASAPDILHLRIRSAPGMRGACSFGITSTGLVGSTVVLFEPARD
jgi:hypothetical protein